MKNAQKKPRSSTAIIRSPINPLREGTLYSRVFDYLYHCRNDGIARHQAIDDIYQTLQRKHQKRLIGYALSVVSSPTEDGAFHRSAKNIANVAWFEKENGWIRMRLRCSETARIN